MRSLTAIVIFSASLAFAQDFPPGVYPGRPIVREESPRDDRVLFFHAKWCPPCNAGIDNPQVGFRPWLSATGWKIGPKESSHIQLVDIDENPQLAAKYGVATIPAMVRTTDGTVVQYSGRQSLVNLLPVDKPRSAVASDVSEYAIKLKVANGMGIGSGVNTAAGVLTCYHVASLGGPIQATCGNETVSAVAVRFDPAHDLALLRADWKQPHPTAEAATVKAAIRDAVESVGRADNGLINAIPQTVIGRRTLVGGIVEVKLSVASNQTRSGGGVFNSDGKLVGIIMGNDVQSEPYVGNAVDLEPIVAILKAGR